MAKLAGEWARSGRTTSGWFDRVSALTSAEPADSADVLEAGEGLLNAVAKNPAHVVRLADRGHELHPPRRVPLRDARRRMDRLPDLVAQGIKDNDAPRAGSLGARLRPVSGAVTPVGAERLAVPVVGRLTAADIWIKVKDTARARKALLELQSRLEASKPKGDPKDAAFAAKQRPTCRAQADYWQRMGDLATLEGHKTDAMTFYQNAMLARPAPPTAGAKDELGEKARALWTELGGSNEGWQAWFTAARSAGRRGIAGAARARRGRRWRRRCPPSS